MKSTRARFLSTAAAIAAVMVAASPASAQTAPGQPAAPATPPPAGAKKQDIVVTGTKQEVNTSADRVSFNVANDLQVQTGTLADALRSVPGG